MWQLQVAPLCWLLCHINIAHNQPPTCGDVAAETDKQQLSHYGAHTHNNDDADYTTTQSEDRAQHAVQCDTHS